MSRPKHNISSDCICERVNCSRRLACARVSVHAHTAEILPEARLEEGARICIERMAR
jgi:hypothetical protein